MLFAPNSKYIPVEEGIIDKEYIGFKTSDSADHFCYCTYKGNGVVFPFNKEDRAESGVIKLRVETTAEDREIWFKNQFKEDNINTQANLYGLYHDMYDVGDATHEMYNAWISFDFYEMNIYLLDEQMSLVGIAPAPYGCFSFDDNDVCAFIAEYDDNGERIWCHGSKRWIESMREQMQNVYNNLMKG